MVGSFLEEERKIIKSAGTPVDCSHEASRHHIATDSNPHRYLTCRAGVQSVRKLRHCTSIMMDSQSPLSNASHSSDPQTHSRSPTRAQARPTTPSVNHQLQLIRSDCAKPLSGCHGVKSSLADYQGYETRRQTLGLCVPNHEKMDSSRAIADCAIRSALAILQTDWCDGVGGSK
jgi:hypothetical protein